MAVQIGRAMPRKMLDRRETAAVVQAVDAGKPDTARRVRVLGDDAASQKCRIRIPCDIQYRRKVEVHAQRHERFAHAYKLRIRRVLIVCIAQGSRRLERGRPAEAGHVAPLHIQRDHKRDIRRVMRIDVGAERLGTAEAPVAVRAHGVGLAVQRHPADMVLLHQGGKAAAYAIRARKAKHAELTDLFLVRERLYIRHQPRLQGHGCRRGAWRGLRCCGGCGRRGRSKRRACFGRRRNGQHAACLRTASGADKEQQRKDETKKAFHSGIVAHRGKTFHPPSVIGQKLRTRQAYSKPRRVIY